MKKKLSTIVLIVLLLGGLAVMLYPTVSDYWNSLHQSRAIASYVESAAGLSQEELDRLWSAAEAYNQALVSNPNPLVLSEAEEAEYESLLDITGNGIMGYIDIPKIDCTLPIYHGTSESVLQVAVGHIPGTSLPVGGESSHCVLSGHRGLPSAKLFTNLDQMIVGDIFTLEVLNVTLTYEVDQIRIVEPQEVNDLRIERGEDFCTLVTCTPYGINTHRLLVRGHRIENLETATSAHVTSDAITIDSIMVAPVVAAPMGLILLVLVLTHGGKKTAKNSAKTKKKQKEPPKT